MSRQSRARRSRRHFCRVPRLLSLASSRPDLRSGRSCARPPNRAKPSDSPADRNDGGCRSPQVWRSAHAPRCPAKSWPRPARRRRREHDAGIPASSTANRPWRLWTAQSRLSPSFHPVRAKLEAAAGHARFVPTRQRTDWFNRVTPRFPCGERTVTVVIFQPLSSVPEPSRKGSMHWRWGANARHHDRFNVPWNRRRVPSRGARPLRVSLAPNND